MDKLEREVKDLKLDVDILADTLMKTMKAMELVIRRVETIEHLLEDID